MSDSPPVSVSARAGLARSGRQHVATCALLAPIVLFLVFAIVWPVGLIARQSVADGVIRDALPATLQAVRGWNGLGTVPDAAYSSLALDLCRLEQDGGAGRLAARLNESLPGVRSLVLRTARSVAAGHVCADASTLAHWRPDDERWQGPALWRVIQQGSSGYTSRHWLGAFDLAQATDGSIVARPASESIYRSSYWNTFSMALLVTFSCLMLGLPLAAYIASRPVTRQRLYVMLLLVPLWTSALVRAMAWILLLSDSGLANRALLGFGLVDAPLSLVFNKFSIWISFTHMVMPFMVLPIINAMRQVGPEQRVAAESLGARPWTVFLRVQLPQCRRGIAAGCLLAFVACIGFYVTPALVGGGGDLPTGYFVAQAAIRHNNLGLASAASLVLLMLFLLLVGLAAWMVRRRRPDSLGGI